MLDNNDPFYSSKFGIDWAEDHITEFEREAETFFKPDVYAAIIELDADGAYNLLKLKLAKPMPRALNGHVIDIVHNLRAALDQAIFSVATLNNTLSLSGTPSFPIRDNNAEFEKAFNGITGKYIPQEISDTVRRFKPYKGGNDLIWALNKLSNTKKHGFIRPLPIAAGSIEVKGTTNRGKGPQVFLFPQWDSFKNEMILARAPAGDAFTMDFDYSFFVAFDDIELVAGKPVVPTLSEILDKVRGIVMAIEAETIRIGLI